MVVIGLTGSIGMGKSTCAAMARRLGILVHDADATVHALMGPGGPVVDLVEGAFPGVIGAGGGIDRKALGARVLGDTPALRRLEAILHPRVREAERQFLRRAALSAADPVILDIPLLLETQGENRCDLVMVVTAPRFLQTQRVLRRTHMTRATLEQIRARQTPDVLKRRVADVIIPTGLGPRPAVIALKRAIRLARNGTRRPLNQRTFLPHA
ncbi:MAG: dephospho-CoA kinase [Rhodospirillum sp.]|nr:dephospho-CoA kinase [Rhodospirillum sp.]MCF8491642.1 dephospho-CoA kinase [Rhodospirillum sp.]MCF8500117.1 dephospho-CoA kinase [Rhodospirillum sp.]